MTNQILEQLINNFSIDQLVRFFRNKNRFKFRPQEEEIFIDDGDLFSSGMIIGKYEFSETEVLVICAIQTTDGLSERSGKQAQIEKAKKIIGSGNYDAGIFVFYDQDQNCRFSLIYPNYKGTKIDWDKSRFTRFTYFVSKELTNKTFILQFGDGDFSSIEAIKETFSVIKVTNKFFEEFRTYFEKTKKEFESANKNTVCLWLKDKYSEEEYKEQINKFAFTFLGRIIFLYFLLRKGWIEDQKDYIRNIVSNNNNTCLYKTIFEPLFFDVFATRESERKPATKAIYHNTPYLNGGLFERGELEEELERSGNFILFDDLYIRDIILNYFEAYNFTVDENSIDDQEVSIDPEMLGKVFENTLAEEERGKKGTFYTPREVVHFMVKEALLQFLINETKIEKEKLHGFLFEENFDLEKLGKENIRIIDDKLDGLKVLDPAVGSAAFPVEMMQILVNLRKRLSVKVGRNINEVALKKSFIKNNLYGVDIDPSAIEIAKLRLWLTLIVDYEKTEAEPLPNLDFQFRVGNSLQEKIDDIDIFNEVGVGPQGLFKDETEYEKMKDRMITIKDRFYLSKNETEKHRLKTEFDELEHQLIWVVLKKYKQEFQSQIKNQKIGNVAKALLDTIKRIDKLEQKIKDGTYKLFKPDFHFSEVFDRKNESGNKIGGFDIVIGNPPYGVAVDDDIKDLHGLRSKDSYGVFISTALKRFLKSGGVLSFIVSDTWLTIKSHKSLREQVINKRLHKIVRLHQDCFEATVNACVMSLSNKLDDNNKLIAADLSNISTRKDIEELRNVLYHLEEHVGKSTSKLGVYSYQQSLIKSNSNEPIFVASPNLFRFMSHSNGVIKLSPSLADVKKGIDTGENKYFLYQNPNTRGSYRIVPQDFVLSDDQIFELSSDEKRNGINSEKHNGKFIIPYDKGGESDTDSGWLPNYYVPTNYFIDWSRRSVKELRNRVQRKSGNHKATIRNENFWFRGGITFSLSGQYSPTVRINSSALFDNGGSTIFPNDPADTNFLLGILASKIGKYIFKNYIDHTIHAHVDDFKEMPIPVIRNPRIQELVYVIIQKQKSNLRYDYMINEQKEIDKLVYEIYGLNNEEIREVETWYARRYPKLAKFCDL